MTQKEESILRRILKLRIVFIVNVLILIGIGVGLGKTYWNNYHLKKEINALEAEAQGFEAKSIEIGKLKRYFESPAFLEEEARLKLGLQKQGEQVVVVGGLATSGTPARETAPQQELKNNGEDWRANPRKWWKYFFK